jgi:hypothetical protein
VADTYVQLSYNEWKVLEETCRAFKETTHGEGTPWYHKSFRLPVGDTTWEFHAPLVKARMVGKEYDDDEAASLFAALQEANGRVVEQRTTLEELTQRIAALHDDLANAKAQEQ